MIFILATVITGLLPVRGDTMKKVLSTCLFIGLCFLFSSSVAFGEDAASIVPKHTFEVGLGVFYFDYEEESLDVEIDGFMYGVVGRYTYHNKIMISANLEYNTGDLRYDGHSHEFDPFWGDKKTTPANVDTVDWKVECQALIGYDYVFRENHIVTPFLGIGYRYWNDHIEGSTTATAVIPGIERKIEYWYSPIGLKTYSPLSDNWTWGMSLEYDLFWDGKVETRIVGFIPELEQDSGYGLKFSLRFSRQFANDYALSIEPRITYWHIDKSDTAPWDMPGHNGQGEAYEPENETTSYGLCMSLEF